MPHDSSQEKHKSETERSSSLSETEGSSSFMRWWHTFHFSGRVIMCSVLFGFGLILIGGLFLAISSNDNNKSEPEDLSNDITTKAPSKYVGPVLMGLGSFVVIVGVVMCLCETQVCRKRTADSRPLISESFENEREDSEQNNSLSTSQKSKKRRFDKRKGDSSPKRTKGRSHKHHSKEKNSQKTPSHKSPPISIDTSRTFSASTDENFLTPPNTLETQNTILQDKFQSIENQTSSSFMKSFASSVPSLTQSSEFQTPSTSFREQSMSLENSTEINESPYQNLLTSELYRNSYMNTGFLTPVQTEEDKIKDMLSKIDSHINSPQKSASIHVDAKVSQPCDPLTDSKAFEDKSDGKVVIKDKAFEENQINVGNQLLEEENNLSKKDIKHDENSDNNLINNGTHFSNKRNFDENSLLTANKSKQETSELNTNDLNISCEDVYNKKTNFALEISENIQGDLHSSTSSNDTLISPNISHQKDLVEEKSIAEDKKNYLKNNILCDNSEAHENSSVEENIVYKNETEKQSTETNKQKECERSAIKSNFSKADIPEEIKAENKSQNGDHS